MGSRGFKFLKRLISLTNMGNIYQEILNVELQYLSAIRSVQSTRITFVRKVGRCKTIKIKCLPRVNCTRLRLNISGALGRVANQKYTSL